VCHAYLADVADGESLEDQGSPSRRSKWFTRKRKTLCNIINDITGVPTGFLARNRLSEASIAQRMSWAARRTATRKEDAAYCLLGISTIFYGQEIVVGGPKSTVDTKKKSVMGSEMFVAVFTSTPVKASSQRTWRSIVVWILLYFVCIVDAILLHLQHSTVPVSNVKRNSAAPTFPFILSSFGIAIVWFSFFLEAHFYTIMRLLFTTVGIIYFAIFLLYLRRHSFLSVEPSLLIMAGTFLWLLLHAESWVQTECPGI
jgi:hypothetical protein